ncbi:MAG: polyribonucleotide nucleotidyltransferase [Candidatus Gracilibacteria bacterium]|nr:polyribonucleotide nucleotidyltransferase [Candidatus Gracilibacteria bacterium]
MIGLSDKNATKITPLKKSYSIEGKNYIFETGKLGLLTNGAVMMSDDLDNVMFTTAGFKTEGLNTQADFFPLVVDYVEKFYATGLIGGNRFQRREGRPTDSATLIARLIDRPIRPMFPKGIINDTQILVNVLSATGEKDLGTWGITSSSLALMMTGAPFEGPVAGVKVITTTDGKFIFDPSVEEEDNARLSLVVAGTLDAITMVEAGGHEVSDEEMMTGLEYAHKIIKDFCNAQIDYIEDYKKQFGIPEIVATYNNPDVSMYELVREFLTEEKLETLYEKGKKEFQYELNNLDLITKEYFREKGLFVEKVDTIRDVCSLEEGQSCVDEGSIGALVYKRVKEVMRKNVLVNSKRLDGRKLDEVREVIGETGLLPRTHGSALFQRGMTQALSIVTLGGPDDALTLEGMMPESSKRYFHQYNFPPYSVGEVRMMRGVGRREIGHGALAERALVPVLPDVKDFPYTMRVVSEITTCNGSSSMASVCGSTMSLMHAGVPIKAPVAGVAMGMIYDDNTGDYKILSDIQAQEDFLGDMDFKLARTGNGITAMQLDVKIKGLKMQVFRDAFSQGKEATDYILSKMLEVQPSVNTELSKYAPLIMTMEIPVDKIRAIIGKGGENVQRLEAEYDVRISIADDGITTITARNQEGGQKAISEIKEMLWIPDVGYKGVGKIVKIIDGTGAIVEFRGQTGMIHISKLAATRVVKVEDVVNLGDMVEFEIIQVDTAKGKISLKKKFDEIVKKVEVVKKEDSTNNVEKKSDLKTEENIIDNL